MLKLPENFENYEEARREGFLKVKALKEKGTPVVVSGQINLSDGTAVQIIK